MMRPSANWRRTSCTTTPAVTGTNALAVGQALAAYITGLGLGAGSIVDLPFRAAGLVPGLTTDVPTFAFDVHSSPVNTANITLARLQIAVLTSGTGNILVNGAPG